MIRPSTQRYHPDEGRMSSSFRTMTPRRDPLTSSQTETCTLTQVVNVLSTGAMPDPRV